MLIYILSLMPKWNARAKERCRWVMVADYRKNSDLLGKNVRLFSFLAHPCSFPTRFVLILGTVETRHPNRSRALRLRPRPTRPHRHRRRQTRPPYGEGQGRASRDGQRKLQHRCGVPGGSDEGSSRGMPHFSSCAHWSLCRERSSLRASSSSRASSRSACSAASRRRRTSATRTAVCRGSSVMVVCRSSRLKMTAPCVAQREVKIMYL